MFKVKISMEVTMKFLRRILLIVFLMLGSLTLISCSNDQKDPVEQEQNYNVDFVNTNIPSITVNEGEKVPKPDEPSKDGYIFDNWYEDDEFKIEFDFDKPINEDTKLYALFYLTILEADKIGYRLSHDQVSNTEYYMMGTIKSIDNGEYGNMTITDGENDFYIYGVFKQDGRKYQDLENRPVVRDIIYIRGPIKKFHESRSEEHTSEL